jgi:hypothetical protein
MLAQLKHVTVNLLCLRVLLTSMDSTNRRQTKDSASVLTTHKHSFLSLFPKQCSMATILYLVYVAV